MARHLCLRQSISSSRSPHAARRRIPLSRIHRCCGASRLVVRRDHPTSDLTVVHTFAIWLGGFGQSL
jgi:hypothetical protein